MKKAQMKAGELYGYATSTSEYRSPVPMIVLDVGQLWTWSRNGMNGERRYLQSIESRPCTTTSSFARYTGDHGYLALEGSRYGDEDDQVQTIDKMLSLWGVFKASERDADAVNELARQVKDVSGVSLEIVNNRWIEDTWEAARRAETERDKARNAKWDAQREAENKKIRRVNKLNAELTAQGYAGPTTLVMQDRSAFGDNRVTIDAKVLAALLDIELED